MKFENQTTANAVSASSDTAVVAVKTSKMSKRARMQYWGVVWILPAFALLLIFCLYPTFTAFKNAFTDWDGGVKMQWVWFANFKELLFEDVLFWRSLLNVVILTVVGMILGNAANLTLAEVMYNLRSKLTPIYRFLFVLPAMAPGIVVAKIDFDRLGRRGNEPNHRFVRC